MSTWPRLLILQLNGLISFKQLGPNKSKHLLTWMHLRKWFNVSKDGNWWLIIGMWVVSVILLCYFTVKLSTKLRYVGDPPDQLRLSQHSPSGVLEQLSETRVEPPHHFRSLLDSEIGLVSFDLQSRSGCCPLTGPLMERWKRTWQSFSGSLCFGMWYTAGWEDYPKMKINI